MGSDGEKTFKQIFQQNISNGTKVPTRNPLLRSLVKKQKNGTIEDLGEFKAVVYCLSEKQSKSIDKNQNPNKNVSCSSHQSVSCHDSCPEGSAKDSRSRKTTSPLSSQASSLKVNSTDVKNDTPTDSQILSTSKGSANKACDTRDDTDNDKSESGEVPRSTLYMVDDCNHVYRLKFFATNINIAVLAFNDARLPPPANDKCTQAYSTDHYQMKFFRKHSRELNYVHYHELSYTEAQEKKKEKAIMPKCTSDVVKKEKTNIASPQRSPSIKSTIYIDYENFRLCLHPTTLIRIDRVSVHKPKKGNEDTEYQVQSKQGLQPILQEDTTCAQSATKYLIDTGNLTIFQNNDIYGVYFSLTDCVLERIVPIHQLATTTPLPDLVYTRITSLTSKKKFIYAPLPRTTYFYENPMTRISFKNRHNRLYGRPPEWKSQMMQEKIKQGKKDKYNTMLTNANRMGSCRIYFATNSIHIRARSKAMKMLVAEGEERYDEWAVQQKRQFIQPETKPAHPITTGNVCRVCNQLLQGAEAKSPESTEVKEDVDYVR